MKNAMVILGAVLILLGMIVGCEQKGSGGERNMEVGKSERGILGKYVSQDNPQEYVEFKRDGTVYVKQELLGNIVEIAGKWKTESDEILLVGPLGGVDRYKIKGNTLIDKDGRIWTKQGETRKETSSEREVSNGSIAGRYTVEELRKDKSKKTHVHDVTIFREDGRMVLRSSGSEFVIPNQRWEFKDGVVQIYQGEGKPLEGRIEGDAIVFEGNGVELKYIKQNGHPLPTSSTKLRESGNLSNLEEDEKRLRTKPATEPNFKKLSTKDEIQVKRLWELVITQRKMARLPIMVGYKQTVNSCREIIRRWPESEYAFKAKTALVDLPERYRKQYNITDEEVDL